MAYLPEINCYSIIITHYILLGGLILPKWILSHIASDIPSWHLLCYAKQTSLCIDLMATAYQNQPSISATIRIVSYTNSIQLINCNIIGSLGSIETNFLPMIKYKKESAGIKIWCFAGDIVASFSRRPYDFFKEQSPDSDAILVTSDIMNSI